MEQTVLLYRSLVSSRLFFLPEPPCPTLGRSGTISCRCPVFLNFSVTISCGEMTVIQYPDLHFPFSCFLQNNVHIPPPAGPHKIRMWAAFYTHRTNICIINYLHVFSQHCFRFTVLPEKGENIIFHLSMQQAVYFGIHKRLLICCQFSSCLYFCLYSLGFIPSTRSNV